MEYNWKEVEVSDELKEFLRYVKKVVDTYKNENIIEYKFALERGLCEGAFEDY